MAFDFDPFDAVLLDLDGTVYHEDHALPGAVELIRRLQAEGRTYACLTNSTSSPERLAVRLQRMGVEVDPAHIYTAATAACDYVMERFAGQSPAGGREDVRSGEWGVGSQEGSPAAPSPPAPHSTPPTSFPPPAAARPRVYNLSTEAVHEMLDGRVHWVAGEREPCDAVVCGAPLNVFATPERQRAAMVLLRRGAALVAICADPIYPSPRGLEFGVGAMSAMLAYAAGVQPVYCGKPEAFFFRELCHRLGVSPSRCVLFGDNLESDIAGARAVDMRTVLVLTGITTRADTRNLPHRLRPDAIVGGLADV